MQRHVFGARILGIVELYRIDRQLGCDWFVDNVDGETRQMDITIRRLSKEIGPLD